MGRRKLMPEVSSAAAAAALPAKKTSRRNRREYQRAEVSLLVIVSTARSDIKGRIINLSLGGAFLLLPELPDLSRPVSLIIEIPKVHVIVVSAEIVRFDMRPIGDGPYHRYGVAVRFLNLSKADRLLLSNTLFR
jgi:c-di-GMP-binding flagellar brake protein YcgR